MNHFCVDRNTSHIAVNRNAKHICLELKVCEGCGGLWLRARHGAQNGGQRNGQHPGVYCRNCAIRLSEFPAPRGRSRAGRPRLRLTVCEGGTK